jgi:GT2 family glycosyltransferase
MGSLPRWRADIEAQTRAPDEIVIVDNVSSDGTQEFLSEWAKSTPTVKVHEIKCGAAQGRNIAIKLSENEHIVSTDMGVRIDPIWFAEIVRPFEEDSEVEVVAGNYAIDVNTVKSPVTRAEYYLEDGGFARFGRDFVVGNRSVAYNRKVWDTLGGLPEDLTLYADDSVFGRQILQARYKMAFAPKALVYWARPQEFKDHWKESYNYGRGDGEANIKIPIAYRWHEKGLMPAIFVPWLTAIRSLQKHWHWKAVWQALKKGDVSVILSMPVLLFGRGYHFGKGFLVGSKWGKVNCLQCRERLTKHS